MTDTKNDWITLLKEWCNKEPMPNEESIHIGNCELKEEIKLGTNVLMLNGAGFRFHSGSPLYLVALYTPEPAHRHDTLQALLGARRTEIIICRNLNAGDFVESLKGAIIQNTNPTAQEFIRAELEELSKVMCELGELKKDDRIHFDWIPKKGTYITYNGELIGDPIRGKALNDAVLSIWTGDRPLDDTLKMNLLGL